MPRALRPVLLEWLMQQQFWLRNRMQIPPLTKQQGQAQEFRRHTQIRFPNREKRNQLRNQRRSSTPKRALWA